MAVITARTLIIYLTLLLTMRILGKRQLGQLELSEFILAALAADMAAHPLQDLNTPLINGLLPVLCLFCFEIIIAGLSMKSGKFRRMLCGKPSIVIKDGRVLPSQLRKNRLTIDELTESLRSKGCTDMTEVQYAVLETDGSLSLLLYGEKRPATCENLGIKPPECSFPRTIISGGRTSSRSLSELGYDEKWLKDKLNELEIASAEDVFYLSCDKFGKIYCVRRDEE